MLLYSNCKTNLLAYNQKGIHKYADKDKVLILHYKYDAKEIFKSLNNTTDVGRMISESDLQIGMIFRKGTQKKYGQTINIRLDVFVPKQTWDKIPTDRLYELKYIQHLTENRLLQLFRMWNKEHGIDTSPCLSVSSSTTSSLTSTSSTSCQQQYANNPVIVIPCQDKENLVNGTNGTIHTTNGTTTTNGTNPSIPLNTINIDSPPPLTDAIKKGGKYLPLCMIGMRDIFKIELASVTTTHTFGSGNKARKYHKTVWYFPMHNIPSGYINSIHSKVAHHSSANNSIGVPVGVTTYNDFWTQEELSSLEKQADETDEQARVHGRYDDQPYTFQSSSRGGKVCRTKFFFCARYLWTKDQMDAVDSHIAGGIRADVAEPPNWIKNSVAKPIVDAGFSPSMFLNSYAMNIYHDGSEGLGQHFDDKSRFARPITTVRLFSDSRLSFGSKDFSMTNSLFFIPMPRGCVTVMEENGYAADVIKHCIRPADMSGKSGVILLRQIHPHLMKEARKMQRKNDIGNWLQSIDGLEDPNSYLEGFLNEEINFSGLSLLNECDLKNLGFTKMGPRKVVLDAVEKLRTQSTGITVLPQKYCTCHCKHENATEGVLLNTGTHVAEIKVKELFKKEEEEEVLECGGFGMNGNSMNNNGMMATQQMMLVTPPGHKRTRSREEKEQRNGRGSNTKSNKRQNTTGASNSNSSHNTNGNGNGNGNGISLNLTGSGAVNGIGSLNAILQSATGGLNFGSSPITTHGSTTTTTTTNGNSTNSSPLGGMSKMFGYDSQPYNSFHNRLF